MGGTGGIGGRAAGSDGGGGVGPALTRGEISRPTIVRRRTCRGDLACHGNRL